MKVIDKMIKLILVASLLCGCQMTTILSGERLILKEPSNTTTLLVTETITETWSVGTMPEVEYAEYKKGSGGISWIASLVEGTLATVSEDYFITLDEEGNVISKTPVIGSRVETSAIAPKMQFGGTVSVGSEFFPKMYTYGVDCEGCTISESGVGGTSVGVNISKTSVIQPNGKWKEGIKYGDYYIVAADPSIPLCSILTIYDHGFSGKGLTPGKPFQVIVLDRGGAIRGAELDLFVGTENTNQIKNNTKVKIKAVINRVGGKNGKNACKL